MIRAGRPDDVARVFELVLELAEYERLTHLVSGTADDLRRHVFETRACRLLVAEDGGEVVGYAISFTNFSTFKMKPGLYLEDIYVQPSHRGKGLGKALLLELIDEAKREGFGRVEWSVLDWNQTAIDFYHAMGADVMTDWRLCRITLP